MSRFCTAPYYSLYIDTDGTMLPCSCSELKNIKFDPKKSILEQYNSSQMVQLRKNLGSDIKDETCNYCWHFEDLGYMSGRRSLNQWFQEDHKELQHHIQSDYTVNSLTIRKLELRFSNRCNLTCRTCGPRFSNAWYSDWKKLHPNRPIEKHLNSQITIDSIKEILDQINHITFAGGEPLVADFHYDVLEYLVKNNTNLAVNYVTNFSRLDYGNYDIIELWKKFPNLWIVASLDGNHERGEYLRKGLKWDQVIANRIKLRESCPSAKFRITAVLNIMNAYNIMDFHKEWVDLGYIEPHEFDINLLLKPDVYCLSNLTDYHKDKLRIRFQEYINWLESYNDIKSNWVIEKIKTAIHLLDEPKQVHWDKLWERYHLKLDEIRGEDFYEIFPEYNDRFQN